MLYKKGSILIVDDEDIIRNLLMSEFSKLGYETISAINGEDALNKLNTEKVQIVITDMKMPKFGGLDVLKAVKEKSPKSEVIIITGHATVEEALEAMKGGAYDFIQKPFNIDELIALVEKALEKNELNIMLALYESSNAIFSSLDLEDLFPIMISLLKDVTNSKDVSIFLFDSTDVIYLASSSIPMFDSRRRELEDFILGVCRDNNTKCLTPISFETKNPPEEFGENLLSKTEIKSILLYPIILRNKIFGYILITKSEGMTSFVSSDIKNVSVFVAQIAQAINNANLYEKLKVKIAELEQTLIDLDTVKKEIQVLKEDTDSCL
ncbi:MAG: response regulator [Endomicrobium sp.]|jgi:CheY-like chemotaxis protein|nr:response regulator [Endomicrobium sp.]MDR2399909.1 response regulator [Endomicrobium sp.]